MSARAGLLVAALLVVPATVIARAQPTLAKTVHDVKQRDDVYVLPPPAQLRAMTLGYQAAAVDLLWAKLLVEYGTHWHERRSFDAKLYLDAILELEPDYAPLYKYADTLLIYRPPRGDLDDARAARRYLERGLKERPGDYQVWQTYGQYMAFIGPSFLPTQDERDAWRKAGAEALVRAVDLGADAERSLAAASILGRMGEHDAVETFLKRAYAVADDPQTREEIAFKLQRSAEAEAKHRASVIESDWQRDYPFLTRGEFVLMGPPIDPLRCAGPASADDAKSCPRDWETAVRAEAR